MIYSCGRVAASQGSTTRGMFPRWDQFHTDSMQHLNDISVDGIPVDDLSAVDDSSVHDLSVYDLSAVDGL